MRFYTCPHGEHVSKKCLYCRRIAKMLRDGQMRACSDCMEYAPVKDMATKSDGRVICADCQRKVEAIARDRAQGSLFVEQNKLFDAAR